MSDETKLCECGHDEDEHTFEWWGMSGDVTASITDAKQGIIRCQDSDCGCWGSFWVEVETKTICYKLEKGVMPYVPDDDG